LSEFSSSYGNSDASSGVIDLGDEGVIGDVVVSFLIDFGRPQTSDSVELTNSSFGLLGSHICAFSSGDMVVVPAELGGEGGGGGGGAKGIKGDIQWVKSAAKYAIYS
jgi:hypothetical protein